MAEAFENVYETAVGGAVGVGVSGTGVAGGTGVALGVEVVGAVVGMYGIEQASELMGTVLHWPVAAQKPH